MNTLPRFRCVLHDGGNYPRKLDAVTSITVNARNEQDAERLAAVALGLTRSPVGWSGFAYITEEK